MIENFFNKLANIPNDKLLHFFYGSIIGFCCVALFSWMGVLMTLGLAILKESLDIIEDDVKEEKPNFKESVIDIMFTIIPSILFLVIDLF
jgi:hypothetical protein